MLPEINSDYLKSLGPCVDRYKNYLDNYPQFRGSFEDFLDLDRISYEDKIWVARRCLNKNQLVQFAILCATSVLHIYEARYPEDKRVSDCLEFLASFTDFTNLTKEQKEQIQNSRRAAAAAAAYAAYAAYAAAYAAYAAADAADAYAAAADAAAADAAAAAAAYAAAYAADAAAAAAAAYAADAAAAAAAYARSQQQAFNIELLKLAASI